MAGVRVALTLPSFVADPEVPIAVARAAEDAGLDGVFAFDHLFRDGRGGRRPALECLSLLGAVASETDRIALGPLVARASLRPPAVLAGGLESLARVSGGRLVAVLGSGDHESAPENTSFGLPFGTITDRVHALADAVAAARGRGFPVWVGGTSLAVREIAAASDGWNRWGGAPAAFASEVAALGDTAGRTCTLSWGGLVVLGADDAAAREKAARLGAGPHVLVGGPARVARHLLPYADAGASWFVLGPVDSRDPGNAGLAAAVAARLRDR